MADPGPQESDPEIARVLSQLYERPFERVREVVNGINRTFEAWSNHDQFFFRLYPTTVHTDADIEFEIESLLHAFRSESPTLGVARPVPSRHRTYVNPIAIDQSERLSCLFVAAIGGPLETTPSDIFTFGAAIAELHAAMDGFLPHHVRRLEPETVVADALEVLSRKPSLLPLRQAIVANEEFLSRLPGRWTSGFCHADAWLGNALLANGRVTFFDFESCAIGPQIFDLSTQLWWLWRQKPDDAKQLSEGMLNGYRSRRALGASGFGTASAHGRAERCQGGSFPVQP